MKRIDGRPRTPEGQRLYWVWAAMIQRCSNPENKGYRLYGGKGIRVCERWRSFDAFLADMGLPPKGTTIERVDAAGDYKPSNCKWASRIEQARNRPTWCRYYTVAGVKMTMREAWQQYADRSITYRSFVKRLVTRGWTLERALSTKARAA